MSRSDICSFQEQAHARALDLRAIAAELELDVGRLVQRSRQIRERREQRRDERDGSTSRDGASRLRLARRDALPADDGRPHG